MNDLPFCYIECNRDEWLYEYYEGSTIIILNILVMHDCISITKNLPLYYTNEIVTNGCMSIIRDLLLYCIVH